MEIFSVFTVTERNGKVWEGEAIQGQGQDLMRSIREEYGRFTKFVLEGFEIEGKFVRLNLKTHNYIR